MCANPMAITSHTASRFAGRISEEPFQPCGPGIGRTVFEQSNGAITKIADVGPVAQLDRAADF